MCAGISKIALKPPPLPVTAGSEPSIRAVARPGASCPLCLFSFSFCLHPAPATATLHGSPCGVEGQTAALVLTPSQYCSLPQEAQVVMRLHISVYFLFFPAMHMPPVALGAIAPPHCITQPGTWWKDCSEVGRRASSGLRFYCPGPSCFGCLLLRAMGVLCWDSCRYPGLRASSWSSSLPLSDLPSPGSNSPLISWPPFIWGLSLLWYLLKSTLYTYTHSVRLIGAARHTAFNDRVTYLRA